MGVSFRVAKAGTRYRPKLVNNYEDKENEIGGFVSGNRKRHKEEDSFAGKGENIDDSANLLVKSGLGSVSEDMEVSFSLNLFPNGFYVGENIKTFNDATMKMHPYNRASETLFAAIEYGWLPKDLVDNVSSKFVNGALLCEIRDFRHLFKSSTTSTVASPVIHKVILQLCMENVIKDITSVSNDSWTYKDLLEVESRILKALQPDLNLNPEPLLGKYCEKSLRKKLDLGITWAHKKRKLMNSPSTDSNFSHQHKRGVISSCIPNLQKDKFSIETLSRPSASRMEPYYRLAATGGPFILGDLPSPNLSPVPTQSLVPFKQYGCGRQAIRRCNLNSQNQPPHNRRNIETGKILNEIFLNRQRSSLLSPYNGQLALFQSKIFVKTVEKQESSETMRSSQSDLLQQPSQTVVTKSPSFSSVENRKTQENKARRETGSRKRKVSQNNPNESAVKSKSVNAPQNEKLPKKASESAKRKKKYPLKDLDTTQNGIDLLSEHLDFHQTSEDNDNSILERFSKIQQVTKRHGLLKNRNSKMDNILPLKSNFLLSQLVGSCLWSSEGNDQLTGGEWIELPNQFSNKTCSTSKCRTLTFVRRNLHHKGTGLPIVDTKVRLIMSTKVNEGVVEAIDGYIHEECVDSNDMTTPLPTFASIEHADLFASQFSSLMLREGYFQVITSNNRGSLGNDVPSSSKQNDFSQAVTPSSGPLMLPFSSLAQSHPYVDSAQLPSNLGKVQSMQKLFERNLSNLQHNLGTQLSPVQQQWEQFYNKHAHTQLQIMQRYNKPCDQSQRMASAGGLGVVVSGNVGRDMGLVGRADELRGRQISSIGNVGESGNMGSDIPNSETAAAVLANLSTADMTYLLSKYQVSYQNPVPQDIRSVLQPIESRSLVNMPTGFSPQSQFSSQSIDQTPQLSYISAPQQMNKNKGSLLMNPESPEVSSRPPSTTSSSARKHGVSQRKRVQQKQPRKEK